MNEVTTEGLPVLFIKDLPPVSSVSIKVTRPQIYFGEMTDDACSPTPSSGSSTIPSGDEQRLHVVRRAGGVRVGSLARRAAVRRALRLA